MDKHWCAWTIRSIHSVGVGADLSRPFSPNCINATTHHSGCTWCKRWCTWVNITCSWNKHWLYINNSSIHSVGVGDRFIAPVHTELYKCNHASQWVYVGKTLVVHGYPQRTFRRRRGSIHRARPHRITTNYCVHLSANIRYKNSCWRKSRMRV